MRKQLTRVTLPFLLAIIVVTPGIGQERQTSTCDAVKSILDETLSLKAGMSRAELEKFFAVGSYSFRNGATYVSKRCRYISVDLQFDLDPSYPGGTPAPTDKIKTISRPY